MNEFAKRLKRERERRAWSQEQLAEQIGTTAPNVGRWERGQTSPGPYFRQQLCAIFGLDAEAFGFVREESEEAPALPQEITPSYLSCWEIPYRRNPFFTGRDDVLTRLHEQLRSASTAILAQVQAISGLGGIGKTSTAIEYAYRYQCEYQTVLWAHAETHDTLATDVMTIVQVLQLVEKDVQDVRRVTAAVKRWLSTHSRWLLILDNVEDFSLLTEMVPAENHGHVLITTRAQSTGLFAQRIDLERMGPDEGTIFLLRRAKLLSPHASLAEVPETQRKVAEKIFSLMDGLPLALDQAGAYIEETGCSLAEYLERYRSQRALLLDLRGGGSDSHPQSVGATVALAVEKLTKISPAAAELLEFCSFLHPDAIPDEMLIEGGDYLGPVLAPVAANACKRDAAIAALRQFSLLRRNPETRTLTVHRLVQAVVRDRMSKEKQRQWAERAIEVVNRAFPEITGDTAIMQHRYQRCILHAQICAALIEQWNITLLAAGKLLIRTGQYLSEYGQHRQAEALLKKALDIMMPALGPEDPDVAQNLHALAVLYLWQGRYQQAEQLLQQALAIREKVLGSEHPDVAQNFNDLGELYYWKGQYVQAELLCERALDMWAQIWGSDSMVDTPLNNLGCLYLYQGKYTKAEHFLTQALLAYDKNANAEYVTRAYVLDNLARLHREKGEYPQAEELFQQALSLRERQFGREHFLVAETLNDWARLCYLQGKYRQGILFLLSRDSQLGTGNRKRAPAYCPNIQ